MAGLIDKLADTIPDELKELRSLRQRFNVGVPIFLPISIIPERRTGPRKPSTAGWNICAASRWDSATGATTSSGHSSMLAEWVGSYSPIYEEPLKHPFQLFRHEHHIRIF